MKVNQQTKYRNQPLEQITRNLVKSALKSKTFDDKFVFVKSALLSRKLRGRIINQNIHINNSVQNDIQPERKFQIQKVQVSVGTQCPFVPQKCHKEVDCSDDVGYLKKTQSFCTQTYLSQTQKIKQTDYHPEIQDIHSKVSIQTQDTYLSQGGFDSFCNFSSESRALNFKKKQYYDEIAYTVQINSLKTQIQELRATVTTIDEQKSKWKKKALKYSSKIKAVEVEQQKFQKAYEKTVKK